MLIAIIGLTILLLVQTIYILGYKSQIKRICRQLAFIAEHDSFKLIDAQIKPQEIYHLISWCNKILQDRRLMKQLYIKKNEEFNDTVTSLSHDIRTPLTSMDGYLQLAERSMDGNAKTDYVRLARSRIKQMANLIDELFLFTKLQNPDYALELTEVDAAEVLRRSLFQLIDAISQTGYEPDIALPESAMVIGNELALERVYENILSNYLLHGSGRLAIWHEASADSLRITFMNLSSKPVKLEKLFDRFYKEDHARSERSSGLGLSIVRSLLDRMNGLVNAEQNGEQFCLSIQLMKTPTEGVQV